MTVRHELSSVGLAHYNALVNLAAPSQSSYNVLAVL